MLTDQQLETLVNAIFWPSLLSGVVFGVALMYAVLMSIAFYRHWRN